jgi:DNA-binding HxlR family transcriptional regulator
MDALKGALAVIGPKYALLIIENLLDGPCRFGEIQRSLGDVNAPVLTVRLRELEAAGLLTRKMYPEIPPHVEYRLTARGHALRPAIVALRRWGARAPRRHGSPS